MHDASNYHWIVDPRTERIAFERLADDCVPRVNFVTNVTLMKK